MRPEIKFCGMTRPEDVEAAGALGAGYVGVIFAGGPRAVTIERAQELIAHVPRGVRRVGVFGTPSELGAQASVARSIGLDVVQLHGDPDAAAIDAVRRRFLGTVWAVVRVAGSTLPERARSLFEAADAVVLDAYSPRTLGGTGLALPWEELAEGVRSIRGPGKLVIAGGLRPENVADAVRALDPDVVDVSSGVESAPGIKDHSKLRAFRNAVRAGVASL